MVSEKARLWLHGLDPKSIELQKRKEAADKAHVIEEERRRKTKEDYPGALSNILESLRTEGMPKHYSSGQRTGNSMSSVDELKGTVADLMQQLEDNKGIFAGLHTGSEDQRNIIGEIADGTDSDRMKNAASKMGAVMSACDSAQEHIAGAIEELDEYLKVLNSL